MQIRGVGEVLIDRPAQDVLETVLQPDLYALADHKIGRILGTERTGDRGWIRMRGRLASLPTPLITVYFILRPYQRLELWSEPRLGMSFRAEFLCIHDDGRTRVQHSEVLQLPWPIGLPTKLLLGRWFAKETAAEVVRLKRLLEAELTGRSARADVTAQAVSHR